MTVEELKKYKDNLYTSLSRDLSEFEKNFLLISGGILAFTITFIKEIVEIESAILLICLYISWGFIIFSIGLMMWTFLRSSIASDSLWYEVDTFMLNNKLFKNEALLNDDQILEVKQKINDIFYRNKKKLRHCRLVAVVSFIIGISFLSIFVSINLNLENKPSTKKSEQIIGNVSSKLNNVQHFNISHVL